MAMCSVSSARNGLPRRVRRAKLCSASWHSTEFRARCVMRLVPQMKISAVALLWPLVMARHSSHLSIFRCRSKRARLSRSLAKSQWNRSSSPEAMQKALTTALLAPCASSRARNRATSFLAVCSMLIVGIPWDLPGILASCSMQNMQYHAVTCSHMRSHAVTAQSLEDRLLELVHDGKNLRGAHHGCWKHVSQCLPIPSQAIGAVFNL